MNIKLYLATYVCVNLPQGGGGGGGGGGPDLPQSGTCSYNKIHCHRNNTALQDHRPSKN